MWYCQKRIMNLQGYGLSENSFFVSVHHVNNNNLLQQAKWRMYGLPVSIPHCAVSIGTVKTLYGNGDMLGISVRSGFSWEKIIQSSAFDFWIFTVFPNISKPHRWHWTHTHTHTHTQSCVFISNWNQNLWITILFFNQHFNFTRAFIRKKSVNLVRESTKDGVLAYKCD